MLQLYVNNQGSHNNALNTFTGNKKVISFFGFFYFLVCFFFFDFFYLCFCNTTLLTMSPPPRTVHLFLDCATGPILLQAVQIIKLPKNEKKLSVGFIFYHTMTLMHKNTT